MKLFVLGSLLLLSRVLPAQTPPDAIDSLARAFSGTTRPPVCRIEPATADGARVTTCQWVAPGEISRQGSVTTTRYPSDSALVTWERPTGTGAEAAHFVDSMGTALRAQRLTMRYCTPARTTAETRARAWERADLLVYASELLPNRGAPMLIIMATTHPAAFPRVICGR